MCESDFLYPNTHKKCKNYFYSRLILMIMSYNGSKDMFNWQRDKIFYFQHADFLFALHKRVILKSMNDMC